jgi:hypothetical protein
MPNLYVIDSRSVAKHGCGQSTRQNDDMIDIVTCQYPILSQEKELNP